MGLSTNPITTNAIGSSGIAKNPLDPNSPPPEGEQDGGVPPPEEGE